MELVLFKKRIPTSFSQPLTGFGPKVAKQLTCPAQNTEAHELGHHRKAIPASGDNPTTAAQSDSLRTGPGCAIIVF